MKKLISKFWQWILRGTTVDEKVIATAKEAKRRAGLIKEELEDVADAVKNVGKQIGDVGDAAKGNARKGRKKKSAK
jgi:hypothetical protein